MQPRIVMLSSKKLIGKRLDMSISSDRTFELWNSFMPLRKTINNTVGTDLYCLQVYADFGKFTADTFFEKWATLEITSFDDIPEGMEIFNLQGGLYAVFDYKGRASDFANTFNYIFYEWLPSSDYFLDQRPHFEILGEKYRNNDRDSGEEIWVPVRRKD